MVKMILKFHYQVPVKKEYGGGGRVGEEDDLLRKILILDILWLKSTGYPGGRCI